MRRREAEDVIVVRDVTSPVNSLGDALRRAFDRAAELAVRNGATSPLELCLIDANARCLLKMTMTVDDLGWSGQAESGALQSRDGISLPWFVFVRHRGRRSGVVRIDLDAQPTPVKASSAAPLTAVS